MRKPLLSEDFSGFIAQMQDGSTILEEMTPAGGTNWSTVDVARVAAISLWWNGRLRTHMVTSGLPEGHQLVYFITATAALDNLGNPDIISRTIGYTLPDGQKALSVLQQATGEVRSAA
jgi:hypothetical protein